MKTLLPSAQPATPIVNRKSQIVNPKSTPMTLISPEDRVLSACHDAAHAERDYVQKACLAGALLLEYRETILAHSGQPSDRSGRSPAQRLVRAGAQKANSYQ